MKNKSTTILVTILLLATLLTACTSSSTAVKSWSGALLTDTNVYFADSGQLYALKSENGNTAWVYPEKASATRLFLAAPALTGEQLIVGDYGHMLTSLSIRDGAENWQFTEAEGRYVDSPLIVEDTIIAPNADFNLYALDLSGNLRWSYKAENAFWAQPVCDGTTVFAPSLDHSLYAIDLKSGDLKWKVDLKSALVARALLNEGIIYIGNLTGNIYAINSEDGSIIWSSDTKNGIWAAPLLVDGKLYYGDQEGNVNILLADDGYVKQSIQIGSAVLGSGVQVPDGIAFGNEDGEVVMLSLTGEKLWTRTVDGKIYSNILVNDDQMIVITTDGDKQLVAMDVNGNENWYFSSK